MSKSKSDGRLKSAGAAETGQKPSVPHGTAKPDSLTDAILEMLKRHPKGLYYGEIVEQLSSEIEHLPPTRIEKALAELLESGAQPVEKPSRGFYRCRADSAELAPEEPREEALANPKYRCGFEPRRPVRQVRRRVVDAALEVLKEAPEGLYYTDLFEALLKKKVGASRGAIRKTITGLPELRPKEVERPYRGFYRHRRTSDKAARTRARAGVAEPSGSEKDFYRPFANWLLQETEECTKAVALGASSFGAKWGTPDVIGILQKKRTDPVEFPPEIVSAEIKTDDRELITAFGQACAYKLFSHKSYLVVPKSASREDIDRLDSLCLVLGIGLVLFNSANSLKPDFEIRVRPAKHAPDMFYVNENLKKVPELCE